MSFAYPTTSALDGIMSRNTAMQRTACTRLGMINLDASLAASDGVGVNPPFAPSESLWYSSTARCRGCLTTTTMTTRHGSRRTRCSGSGPASSSNVTCDSTSPSLQVEAVDRAMYRVAVHCVREVSCHLNALPLPPPIPPSAMGCMIHVR